MNSFFGVARSGSSTNKLGISSTCIYSERKMLFPIAVLSSLSWASATPVQKIFQVLRTSPACPASPSVVSSTHVLIFQKLGNGNKGTKLEDQRCESLFYGLKASDMLILSRTVLICQFPWCHSGCCCRSRAGERDGSTAVLLVQILTKYKSRALNSPFVQEMFVIK